MTANRVMIDSAFPVPPPAGVTVTAWYLDSPEATHPWTPAERAAIVTRYRLPVFVAPRGGLTAERGLADARSAAAQLGAAGVRPRRVRGLRRLVGLDLETQASSAYVATFAAELARAGYATMPYGSASTLFANPRCAGWWVARWNQQPEQYPAAGVIATQYTNNVVGWDLSVVRKSARLCDAGPPARPPWARRVLAGLAGLARVVRRNAK